jgi:outer membrane protein assembly factor BamB
MTKRFAATSIALSLGLTLSAQRSPAPKAGVDWPSFRGANGAGVADGFKTLAAWDATKGEGLRWKTEVEGLGHSSPTIWGNTVCITTSKSGKADAGLRLGLYGDIASVNDDTPHTWKLLCYDKKSGKVALDKTILSGVPKIKRHTKATHANSTLAMDGTNIIAMLGSEGLYAFDMKGKELWKKDFGVLDSGYYVVKEAQWEFGSSPIIHNGRVIVQADVQKDSFLAALDLKTGKELWRTARTDVPTWSTPTIHVVGGKTQILVNGFRQMAAYDFETGAEIWTLKGGGDIPVPTPVIGHGMIFLTSAHGPAAPVFAIKETATGNISLETGQTTNAHVAWSAARDGGYMITPVLYQDLLYVTKNNGVINTFDAKTGEKVYQERLGTGTTGFTASPVAADGKIYFTSEDGDVFVVKAGRTFELLSKSPLGDTGMATPAISEGVLFFRTGKHIMAIGAK